MNNQFDELTKSMAQSVTRRAALKKFGVVMNYSFGDLKEGTGFGVCACGKTHLTNNL